MAKVKKKRTFKYQLIFILISILTSFYLIYRISQLGPAEPIIRYIIISILIIIDILLLKKQQKLKKRLAIFVMVLFIMFNMGGSFIIGKIYDTLDSINKNKIVYSSSLLVLNQSEIESIDDVTGMKIGITDDTLSIDNYVIAHEIIDDHHLDNDNNIISYDDLLIMLKDLYNGKIDSIFISSNYSLMFSNTEGYENISNDVREVITKDKTIEKEEYTSTDGSKNTTKPFSILLMGVDSEKDNLQKNSYANGDSLILVTFNPHTFNATMMSIPRDSYLPISCRNNKKNKLTHAGWYGTDCMIETIENTFDVDINYYVKVNFKGVVNLINALGGVDVEVPKRLCTDNSDRTGTICIEKGFQTLDGEHALVLARNRYDLAQGDIDRGYNQQLLIRAMVKKLTSIRSVDKLLEILDTVSKNLDTNLTTDEILSFYNIFKQILISTNYQDGDVFHIEQLKVLGVGKMIYYENLGTKLWNYILDDESIDEVSKTMKINLEIIDFEPIKTFEFHP
ncbi:MAG: hypothetical protein E7168_00985 [Firmicutes bacterium]|nr:hypothetical protein [Bacillota bacterium]